MSINWNEKGYIFYRLTLTRRCKGVFPDWNGARGRAVVAGTDFLHAMPQGAADAPSLVVDVLATSPIPSPGVVVI